MVSVVSMVMLKIDYSDAPWEKEAYRIEYKLYEEFWNVMQLENNNG